MCGQLPVRLAASNGPRMRGAQQQAQGQRRDERAPGIETRQTLAAAARSLARCRRLGVLLTDVLRVAGAAHGAAYMHDTYGRDGRTGAVSTAHSVAAHY